jgi:hypothetical protein
MNELLLLALVVIYFTISHPPRSRESYSTDGKPTRRGLGFIRKKQG